MSSGGSPSSLGETCFPPPLSFLAVLLRMVVHSHPSLVWCCFLLVGWCCLLVPSSGWCCSSSPPPSVECCWFHPLLFFWGGGARPPPFGDAVFHHLRWVVLLSPLSLVGGAVFCPSFISALPSSFASFGSCCRSPFFLALLMRYGGWMRAVLFLSHEAVG